MTGGLARPLSDALGRLPTWALEGELTRRREVSAARPQDGRPGADIVARGTGDIARGDLTVRPSDGEVEWRGRRLHISGRQLEVLIALIDVGAVRDHVGLSRSASTYEIGRLVWPTWTPSEFGNLARVTISALRRAGLRDLIVTTPSGRYELAVSANASHGQSD